MRFIYSFLFVSFCSIAIAQRYTPVDNISSIRFKIKNFGSSVEGSFGGLKGIIDFDVSNLPNSRFDVTINASTIDTGIDMRDNHLRKSDYFDVTDFPRIQFVSTKVISSDKPNEAIITGKLTIKKTTKEISFPFSYSTNSLGLQLKGEFKIDRRDFRVGGNSFSLSDEVIVMLDVKTAKEK